MRPRSRPPPRCRIGKVVHLKEVRLSLEVDQQVHHLIELAGKVGTDITSARSTRLGADLSYEDSGSCVSWEEEGGNV